MSGDCNDRDLVDPVHGAKATKRPSLLKVAVTSYRWLPDEVVDRKSGQSICAPDINSGCLCVIAKGRATSSGPEASSVMSTGGGGAGSGELGGNTSE